MGWSPTAQYMICSYFLALRTKPPPVGHGAHRAGFRPKRFQITLQNGSNMCETRARRGSRGGPGRGLSSHEKSVFMQRFMILAHDAWAAGIR